jgi:hypothetical protein
MVMLFTASVSFADVPDITNLPYEELLQLQANVNLALWASDGWQEVAVPVGKYYIVGVEIPAGDGR